MRRVLVTGGAGFIGSHLCEALVAAGARVVVLDDLSSGRQANLDLLGAGTLGSGLPVEFVHGSITDPEACARAVEGCDGVLHEAAQVSVPRSVAEPLESYRINVMGTLQVLEAARAAGVRRFVFAASSAAYGDTLELPKHEDMRPTPLSPYASGKLAGEQLLEVYGRLHGLSTVSLRYFNVFGPRQVDDSPYTGVIAIFARALLEGRVPTIFGDGEQTRDMTYIDNVVQANLAALRREVPPGSVINIGCGERVRLVDLHAEIARHAGLDRPPQFGPERSGDVKHSLAAIDKARRLLGYEPRVGWREGLRLTVEWYRQRLRG
jgi:UDP-glucose 4-epimerase